MEIWHRVMFGRGDSVNSALDFLGVKYKKFLLPGEHYVVIFEIAETDHRWPQVTELIREKNAADLFHTVFTPEEILSAEWIRLIPIFEQGYPQPKETWVENPLNYENECPKCGAGFRQKAPFRLAKEPRLGKHDFLCLYWTYTVFCTPKVLEALQAHQIRGYEVWEAIIHRINQPSKVVSQLVFPNVAGPGLADVDKLKPDTCPRCGITKYAYHKRGYMHLKREALRSDVDVLLTHEWFGSGGHSGFREILVSNRLARLILEKSWRGVALKPVEVV
jgi:ribosomal protein S27AE